MKIALLLLSMFAAAPSFAGEVRSWSDQYEDAMVIDCGDGSFVEVIDPNHCGEAMAKGAQGCTELAIFFERVKPVSIDGSVIVLSKNEKTERSLKIDGESATYGPLLNDELAKLTIKKLAQAKVNYACQIPLKN